MRGPLVTPVAESHILCKVQPVSMTCTGCEKHRRRKVLALQNNGRRKWTHDTHWCEGRYVGNDNETPRWCPLMGVARCD